MTIRAGILPSIQYADLTALLPAEVGAAAGAMDGAKEQSKLGGGPDNRQLTTDN